MFPPADAVSLEIDEDLFILLKIKELKKRAPMKSSLVRTEMYCTSRSNVLTNTCVNCCTRRDYVLNIAC